MSLNHRALRFGLGLAFLIASSLYGADTSASGEGGEAGKTPAEQSSRVNLAKFQPVTTAGGAADKTSTLITDGNYATEWRGGGQEPAWISLVFPLEVSIKSVHLYLGAEPRPVAREITFESWTGGTWVEVPSSRLVVNSQTLLNVVFPDALATTGLRVKLGGGTIGVRELAVFGAEYPLGTDVSLNLAKKRPAVASSTEKGFYPGLAVDGYAGNDDSGWKSASGDTLPALEIDFPAGSILGGAHLFLGPSDRVSPVAISLQLWENGAWKDIPGAAADSGGRREMALEFAPVPVSKARLLVKGAGPLTVRELVLLPAAPDGAGFPIGTDVFRRNAPVTNWEQFSDSYWTLEDSATGIALHSEGAENPDLASTAGQYQILYSYATDSFRLGKRGGLKFLSASSTALAAGAGVTASEYSAMPHQTWRLEKKPDDLWRIVNVWNGLALEAGDGGRAELKEKSDDPRQWWRIRHAENFPKKGLADVRNDYHDLGISWEYNWSREPRIGDLPPSITFCPMWWNTVGLETQPLLYSNWQRDGRPMSLLGFNEPDLTIESNMTPEQAVAAWPLLEASDLPLLSPAPATSFSGWMEKFHQQVVATGGRVDFYGAHCYLDPFPEALIGYLTKIHEDWGKPVWLTEFAGFDTSGFGNYSEEQHYQFLAEFLWRTEDLPWLKRYSMFPFYIDPAPEPWDTVPDRRSAMFNASGSSLTCIGELYAAWDADRTIRTGTAYFLSNKSTSFRLANSSSTEPATGTIRASDAGAQWCFESAGDGDRVNMVSLADGRLLAWSGQTLEMVPAGTTGETVEWKWSPIPSDKYGYFFLDHPASGRRLRMDRTPERGMPVSVKLSMDPPGSSAEQAKWRYIKPLRPGNLNGPMGLQAAAGDGRISLKWNAMPGAAEYEVKRSSEPGTPRVTIARVTEARFDDQTVSNGKTYRYVVSKAGATGGDSVEVNALAGWIAGSGFESPAVVGFNTNPPGAAWGFRPPHDRDQSGISANGSGYTGDNPNAPEGTQVAFLQGKGVISQTLSGLVAGKKYRVGFLAAQRQSFQTKGQTWDVAIDGKPVASFDPPQSAEAYVEYSITFLARSPAQILSFVGTNLREGDNTVLIDEVKISLLAD